jgi:Lanthionine-containing peptide SapB precursor RamS
MALLDLQEMEISAETEGMGAVPMSFISIMLCETLTDITWNI